MTAILESKLDSLQESVDMMSSKFDNILNRLNSLEKDNKNLSKDTNDLKVQTSILWSQVTQLKDDFDNQEQYLRRKCLEVIPLTTDEDTDKIIKAVGKLVDVSVRHQSRALTPLL